MVLGESVLLIIVTRHATTATSHQKVRRSMRKYKQRKMKCSERKASNRGSMIKVYMPA